MLLVQLQVHSVRQSSKLCLVSDAKAKALHAPLPLLGTCPQLYTLLPGLSRS